MLITIAPVMPPSSEIPPFHTYSHSSGLENSERCAITYATREPTIAPISAQNNMVLMCSGVTPRRIPIRPRSQPPIMNPTAMPRPCGEMAKSPNRNRSRTGQPMDASEEKPRELRDNTGSESTGGPYERRHGQNRPIARPSRSPLTTSDG